MFSKILCLTALAAVAIADDAPYRPPQPSYKPTQSYQPAPSPAYKPAPSPSYQPAPSSYKEPEYPDHEAKYNYQYAVLDEYSNNNFAHSESRDGYQTNGEYRVALPDGRTQIVTYTADENGYVADVKYDGEAQYPKYEPQSYKSEPKGYSPAPAYKPAPTPAYQPASSQAYSPAPTAGYSF
eukprot:maker-scaffold324_size206069-snap-gene-1.25 protein:Tk12288 transcript:maker-scaffold324_size206069-snap-gene-1.25-mRNA-1 annotation:"cuticle protein"